MDPEVKPKAKEELEEPEQKEEKPEPKGERVKSEEELEKDDYFYVTMAGNVTAHSLESDGALFDGVASIEDGKAEFTVTYDDTRTVRFVINIPNIAA